MGVVYRATDVRLKRSVAIKKVLPAAFTADPERVARFERERKGWLDCSPLDPSEHRAGLPASTRPAARRVYAGHYLAMELIEGESISKNACAVARSPWTTRSRSQKQIAEALEEAHERGIIHRDLIEARATSASRRRGG